MKEEFFETFGNDVSTYYKSKIKLYSGVDEDFSNPSIEVLEEIFSVGRKDLNRSKKRFREEELSDDEIFEEYRKNESFRTGFVISSLNLYIYREKD